MNSQKITVTADAVLEQRREALVLALGALEGVEVLPRAAARHVELTLLALGADAHADMELAARLAGQGLSRQAAPVVLAPVVLIGPAPAPEVLLSAMRAGITEYLAEPVSEADLRAALERLQDRRTSLPTMQSGQTGAQAEAQGGRILLVLGAKGGIGTTTVAVNLADALTRQGSGRTVLLDLAQPQGETPIFLDLEHTYTWADVAANIERLDATYLESVLARHHSGLAVLPAPDFSVETSLDPAVLRQILELLRRSYAQVVVDLGTGAGVGHGDAILEALDMADEVLLVLDLSLPCLARAKRFLEAVRATQPHLLPRLRLVANRKTSESDIGTAEAESILQQPIAWAVANDYKAALSALNQGKPLAEADPRSVMVKGLAAMARDLCRDVPAPAAQEAPGSLWARLRNTPLGLSLAHRVA
jgi:pilus assembly protein CpaE